MMNRTTCQSEQEIDFHRLRRREKKEVGREDGVPLLTELEFQNAQGQNVRIECSDIQWNVPLEESLFDLSVPVDWSLSRTRFESAEYVDTGLTPGVTLQVGPDGQEPLAAAGDVAGVVSALTYSDSNTPNTMRITIELKPEAAQRLHDYADTHPDKLIVLNFNGQLNVAVDLDPDPQFVFTNMTGQVAPELDTAHPNRLSFDLTLLGLSLPELEERYLTTTIERD